MSDKMGAFIWAVSVITAMFAVMFFISWVIDTLIE